MTRKKWVRKARLFLVAVDGFVGLRSYRLASEQCSNIPQWLLEVVCPGFGEIQSGRDRTRKTPSQTIAVVRFAGHDLINMIR